MSTTQGRTKLTVALPNSDLAALNTMAGLLGTNVTTTLVKAVRLLAYVQAVRGNGGRVLVEQDEVRHELAP